MERFPLSLTNDETDTHTWGYGINSDTVTDTKETASKPAHVHYESLGCVSLAWEFQAFAYEGKGTQASKIMNLGFPDTDLTFALSLWLRLWLGSGIN